ncbi:hypothetical protein [Catalinimonas niigatensis]|uniref:hypothetical protein n=1 Tax=Catalinimonas niigatensis TaxID=1397264 RepID=UPI0026669B8E|nr:hypothetical protein [Catalinimonas niigatensis]WPP52898.1 hypothetical protein PZB72_10975 [Catalinimonas niigatensis]
MFSSLNHSTLSYPIETSDRHLQAGNILVNDPNRLLKQGIWIYFLLLIFEGALRKWFLPSLATPLLIVRDPLAIWLIIKVWQRGLLPANIYLAGIILIGITGIFTATLLGHGSLPVALFGARILLVHFPLMFVIGFIFSREDVVKVGKITLWIAVPMTVLMALQFYSPQSAWVNRGVGGDMEGAGFSGAMGYMRPPGTFSFTNGLTLFYSFVAAYVFYFWLHIKSINKLVLIGATLGLLAAIPLSISRSLFFSVGVTLIFTLIAVSHKPQYVSKVIVATFGLIIALVILSQTSFFQTAIEVFTDRLENANKSEGGLGGVLLDRYLGGLLEAIVGSETENSPFFGYGLGMGTNVGSMLLTGDLKYLISEGEWGRLIGEMGPLMGIAVILLRLGFCAKITIASYQKLISGDMLPWILLSFCLLNVPQGQWAQPTALGFSTLIGGLMIASFHNPKEKFKN